jgi:hypothetical protein
MLSDTLRASASWIRCGGIGVASDRVGKGAFEVGCTVEFGGVGCLQGVDIMGLVSPCTIGRVACFLVLLL